jgi:hypothetical protein
MIWIRRIKNSLEKMVKDLKFTVKNNQVIYIYKQNKIRNKIMKLIFMT